MVFKPLLLYVTKAQGLGQVKSQDSKIPHEGNYWGTKGRMTFLVTFQLQVFHTYNAHVEISI